MKGNITIRGILICGLCLLFLGHASACDLMGVSFNKAVDLNNLFSRFRTISEKRDPDGWGVAFYADASATIFKEPTRAAESALAEYTEGSRSPSTVEVSGLFVLGERNRFSMLNGGSVSCGVVLHPSEESRLTRAQ